MQGFTLLKYVYIIIIIVIVTIIVIVIALVFVFVIITSVKIFQRSLEDCTFLLSPVGQGFHCE